MNLHLRKSNYKPLGKVSKRCLKINLKNFKMTDSLLSKLYNAKNGVWPSEQTDTEIGRTTAPVNPQSNYCAVANANSVFRRAMFSDSEYTEIVHEGSALPPIEDEQRVKRGY